MASGMLLALPPTPPHELSATASSLPLHRPAPNPAHAALLTQPQLADAAHGQSASDTIRVMPGVPTEEPTDGRIGEVVRQKDRKSATKKRGTSFPSRVSYFLSGMLKRRQDMHKKKRTAGDDNSDSDEGDKEPRAPSGRLPAQRPWARQPRPSFKERFANAMQKDKIGLMMQADLVMRDFGPDGFTPTDLDDIRQGIDRYAEFSRSPVEWWRPILER
ncbi:hypothetical protein BJX68DRAFT_270429 [Aspergillus pseudodeflectus]|uniref:Uncharacterized protein n=1 Tax=Aspergillus pseudodeflectus TaxID=176178 RepID=A0ABR4JRX7_9EURO